MTFDNGSSIDIGKLMMPKMIMDYFVIIEWIQYESALLSLFKKANKYANVYIAVQEFESIIDIKNKRIFKDSQIRNQHWNAGNTQNESRKRFVKNNAFTILRLEYFSIIAKINL